MITLLTGDNNFELTQALEQLTRGFDGEVTRVDGSDIAYERLVELTSSLSLFAEKRMVVIRDLSSNRAVWTTFGEQLERVSEDTHVVLVEPTVDKRTGTYKKLQKIANVRAFAAWSDRDTGKAEVWVAGQAKQLGIDMDKKSTQLLVQRVGTDQWQLYHALEKLAVLDSVNPEVIESVIEAQPSENVFELLDAALRGDARKVAKTIRGLQLSEDPYRVLALLSSQGFQLATLAVSDQPPAQVAKDIGAHAFALSRLAPHARRLGRHGAKKVIAALAEADIDSKSTVTDTWLLIERALIKIATI